LYDAVIFAHPALAPATEILAIPVDDAAFKAGTLATAGFELVKRTTGVTPLTSDVTVATPEVLEPAVME
jgi:hypothetical protein